MENERREGVKKRATKAQMQAASDKLAAYFRTPEGQRSEAKVAAARRRENVKIAQHKTRTKMVQTWRKASGGRPVKVRPFRVPLTQAEIDKIHRQEP
ncbi:hypothetical protein ES708_02733 [subsurface metagenome]